MAQKINQAEKLAQRLQSDNSEFRKSLGNASDWNKHLGIQKTGFQIDGSFEK